MVFDVSFVNHFYSVQRPCCTQFSTCYSSSKETRRVVHSVFLSKASPIVPGFSFSKSPVSHCQQYGVSSFKTVTQEPTIHVTESVVSLKYLEPASQTYGAVLHCQRFFFTVEMALLTMLTTTYIENTLGQ